MSEPIPVPVPVEHGWEPTDDGDFYCTVCDGNGCEEGCGNCEMVYAGPDSHRVCRNCGGHALKRGSRND